MYLFKMFYQLCAIMTAPDIHNSTKEERLNYVQQAWRCMANCDLCGKCSILKGRDAETVYKDYIEGKKSYVEVSIELRNNCLNL